jgi:UDP-2,3-diacylglucosamine pyrophosphatase LpxH
MNSVIVSDLHIGSQYFLFQNFERFLINLPDDSELILNGDTLDNPYSKLVLSHKRILKLIEKISYEQSVIWVYGNHDNGYIPNDLGQIQFKSTHAIGDRILITHGDIFDKIMPRYRFFIWAFRLMHNLRLKIGAKPMHVAHYAKKWRCLYKILCNNVMTNAVNYAQENGFEAITCGHTHFPEDVALNGVRYINTGSWTEFPVYYLRVNDNDMNLNEIDDPLSPRYIDMAMKTASEPKLYYA